MPQSSHSVDVDGALIRTARLQLAPWTMSDVEAALGIFGDEEVARWLAPAMSRVPDAAAMQQLVSRWVADGAAVKPPLGRWKVTDRATGHTVGAVSLLPLPPDDIDSEISVQIARDRWGNGYAGEAGHAIAHYAFTSGIDEVFAVSRPANRRAAAAARRMGMDWVGQTAKYYGTRLDVFRLRRYDLDVPAIAAPPEAEQTDALTEI
ncbi:Protein N-acetyltransferase, RimJ/RimL family [Nonomuraea maritima]|uniref:Protein N-acetyltransferase, RimJ/RimL family n=1 Tax=Nonomuraea maritima TaxID=683260 RepID=A0A1G8S404_9ACTN|nr:GNAT family N-acetyltransferase [Nonomuraea maritima]SDJ23969.1 Protein N-acetyltransferase, RimJ/RimL family [Nonomuraea maritima]